MATFTVNTAADVVDGNYSQLSLREATAKANSTAVADTILFASRLEGTTLTLTGGELLLSRDVTIDGDRNNDGTEVTLSGGGASRILHVVDFSTDVSLRDLTLTGGRTTGDFDGGGAIRADDSAELQLDRTTVTGNRTYGAHAYGGGISGTTVTLSNSTVTGNHTDGAYAHGGGISGTRLSLTSSTVSGNGTGGDDASGGGLFSDYVVTLSNSTVSGNNASGYRADGGGIRSFRLSLSYSTVSGNGQFGAYGDGGGIFGGTVSLFNSTVADNTAYGDGGGILGYGTVTISNSTLAGNDALESGGAINAFGTLTLSNATVTNNSAYEDAGGITVRNLRGGASISNSIIAGNINPQVGDVDIYGTLNNSNGHNVFGSDVAGAILGDLQGVAPSSLFANLDPTTGGGQLRRHWVRCRRQLYGRWRAKLVSRGARTGCLHGRCWP